MTDMSIKGKRKRDGDPLHPLPSFNWPINNDTDSKLDDKKNIASSSSTDNQSESEETSSTSSDTAVSRSDEDTENSPPKKKRKCIKTNRSSVDPKDLKRNSHVGEQTPHSSTKIDFCESSGRPSGNTSITVKIDAAISPQPIRVRDIPLPNVSWTDTTELSLLMCFKEDISIKERNPCVYRKHPSLNARMRAILFDWLMEVCEVYKLRRATYYLAIDYIDRYLSRTDIIPKNHLQLLGITCLFIAAKLEEIYPPKLSELAYVTDGACSDVDMLSKEMSVLTTLKWDVNTLTVSGWLSLYLQLACNRSSNIRETLMRIQQRDDDIIYPQFSPYMFMTASMLLDLCSLDDGMLQFKYSIIAASAVYYILNREKALFVSGYTWENIKTCVEWMDPFAVVVAKTLSVKPIIVPREYSRSGSALRTKNPSIVLDEGHAVQNHLVNLGMLEEVYEEINLRRRAYREGKDMEQTGWSVSDDGFERHVNDCNEWTEPLQSKDNEPPKKDESLSYKVISAEEFLKVRQERIAYREAQKAKVAKKESGDENNSETDEDEEKEEDDDDIYTKLLKKEIDRLLDIELKNEDLNQPSTSKCDSDQKSKTHILPPESKCDN